MGSATLKVESEREGAIKAALQESGWLDGETVLAAGQLRQGKAPSMLGMITGAAVIEVLRPRRTKQLPRHFVLAVTDSRVVAFKASGGKSESDTHYILRIRPGAEGEWPRQGIRVTELADGPKSKGGMLQVGNELIPVARPNLTGESNTDELLAALGA